MCEAVDFFRQALAEQGLDADITYESDDHSHTFYARKNMAGDTITVTTDVPAVNTYGDLREKEIAMAARAVSEKMDEFLTEKIQCGDRSVTVRPYDEPQATCDVCGASATLPPSKQSLSMSAELSAPHPMPVDDESVLDSLDSHSRVLVKMYLLGRLREVCESSCPNSTTESFI